jgi:small subunit ribosomal protein S4
VHAQKRTKVTDYGVRVREKQKLKRIYGVMERQFKLYFQRPSASRATPARTCSRCSSAVSTTS